MSVGLLARVIPEGSQAFQARIANLTPGSIFILGGGALRFRQAVTVHLGEVALHGEVVLMCRRPEGALVAFRPSESALRQIEDIMDEVEVLEVGISKTSLEDLARISDRELDALPEGDPEGPTNTEGEPLDLEDTDSAMLAGGPRARAQTVPAASPEGATEDMVRTRSRTEPDASAATERAPTVIDGTMETSEVDEAPRSATSKAPKL